MSGERHGLTHRRPVFEPLCYVMFIHVPSFIFDIVDGQIRDKSDVRISAHIHMELAANTKCRAEDISSKLMLLR